MLSAVGVHECLGGILSTLGVFSTVEDILSTVGDIMSTLRDILSTVVDTQYHGGYHDTCGDEYRGGVQYRGGYNLLIFEYLHTAEHPHGTYEIPPHVS